MLCYFSNASTYGSFYPIERALTFNFTGCGISLGGDSDNAGMLSKAFLTNAS